ncbi:MAG: class I SAM-dependent methyltransferase [Promethearchaeota archaeon]
MSDKNLAHTKSKNIEHKRAVSLAFGSIASSYDSWYQTAIGKYVWFVETQALQALYPTTPYHVALEIGVGTGKAISLIGDTHSQLIGIDIAWQMLAIAYGKFAKFDNIQLVLADGTSLPFRNECCDITLSMTVLEFVNNRDGFVQEIYRCLRTAGDLLLGVLTSLNLWAVDRQIRSWIQHDVFELASFPNPWQVVRRLSRNGFTQIRYRGAVYAPSFLPEKCFPFISRFEAKLGNRWPTRAVGAFTVFSAKRGGLKSDDL